MLILTRKAGHSIMIGDRIEVTVLQVIGQSARIGVNAPRDIPIVRHRPVSGMSASAPNQSGKGCMDAS